MKMASSSTTSAAISGCQGPSWLLQAPLKVSDSFTSLMVPEDPSSSTGHMHWGHSGPC